MLFLVSESAAEKLRLNPLPAFVVRAFSRLLGSVVDGMHVVLIDPGTARVIEQLPDFSTVDKAAAKYIRNRYADYGSLPSKLSRYARVVGEGDTPQREGMTWVIPLRWIAETSLSQTRCIGEDLNDTMTLAAAAEDYLEQTGLRAFRANPHPVHGGGGRTPDVFRHEAIEARHICVCVGDSDRTYPGGPTGPVADSCASVTGDGIYELALTSGRSIENSLPWRLVDLVRPSEAQRPSARMVVLNDVDPGCPQFLELKVGLKGFHVRTPGPSSRYWLGIAAAVGASANCCPGSCAAESSSVCQHWILRGYGSGLLADAAEWLTARTGHRKRYASYLPSPNGSDWQRLGALLGEYSLAGMPQRL